MGICVAPESQWNDWKWFMCIARDMLKSIPCSCQIRMLIITSFWQSINRCAAKPPYHSNSHCGSQHVWVCACVCGIFYQHHRDLWAEDSHSPQCIAIFDWNPIRSSNQCARGWVLLPPVRMCADACVCVCAVIDGVWKRSAGAIGV